MLTTFWQSIKERVSNIQLARFALSLIIALFLWGWVTVREDPVETQRYAEIAITPPELPGTLQIVTILPRTNVTITDVSSRLDDITRADISVTLDDESIDGPGSYQVPVIADATGGVREIRVSPDTVSVQVEERVSRAFPLTVENQVLADDSRRIVDVNPEVSEVTVTGTESAVNRIARVILPVSIQEQSSDFSELFEPYAVDIDNQRVQEVAITPAHIRTEVQLEKRGKTVSVVPQITGTPIEGYVVQQLVAVPTTVIVDGPEEVLENLLFVHTSPVDISGTSAPFSEVVPLEDLPEGVTLVDPAVNEVEVRVSIGTSGGSENLIPEMPVEIVNIDQGLAATVDPPEIDVSIGAPASVLSGLRGDEVRVTVDVAGLGPGVYSLTPDVDVPDGVSVTRLEPEQVVVLLTQDGATPESEATPAP